MIMIPGSLGANISEYSSYVSNCTQDQHPYKIPVNSLGDVQLYIQVGSVEPTAIQYSLINTCGPEGGSVETITSGSYVVAQDTAGRWYGVFKNFSGASPVCFVIGITLTISGVDRIFFSEEYCVDPNCGRGLTLLKGCYGNLDDLISYDEEGIYFGTPLGDGAMGDLTIRYEHRLLLRTVEISLSAIKNTFKQGRTRTFRTEKEKIYQFYGEFIPEWYMSQVDAIFNRGEVYIGGVKYLLNETGYEKIEDCKRLWKPSATFKAYHYQSFSCEQDPCAPPEPEPCCDPSSIVATVTSTEDQPCCDPEIISAWVVDESAT